MLARGVLQLFLLQLDGMTGLDWDDLSHVVVDEQIGEHEEEGDVDEKTKGGRENGNVTVATGELGVEGVRADEEAEDHLDNLQGGDCHGHLPGNVHLQRAEGVVAVHARVHHQVHCDEPAAQGDVLPEAVPCVHQREDVVEPMQRN